MLSTWTRNIKDPDAKAQYEKNLRNSKWILDELDKHLAAMETSLSRQEISPSSYDSENWAFRQAHSNGFRQCLSSIRNIINLDKKDTTNDRPATTAAS